MSIFSEATSGTIDGEPHTQTPSRAEHGPEGVCVFGQHIPFLISILDAGHGLRAGLEEDGVSSPGLSRSGKPQGSALENTGGSR